MPRLVVGGIKSEVGKALFGFGLTHELRRRGVGLSCAVSGINLQQALLYRRLSGRYVRTLDERLLSAGQMALSLFFAGVGADLVVIHGHAGFFDGLSTGAFRGSDSDIAALTRTPVLLMVDARGFGTSLGALVKGYADSCKSAPLAGVILNRIPHQLFDGEHGCSGLDESLEIFNQRKAVGMIPEVPSLNVKMPPRSLSQEKNNVALPMQFFLELGATISKYVDIDELIRRASNVTSLRLSDFDHRPRERRCRIGVADDGCFGMCFQDNLDLFRYFGAELISFSPLADSKLPDRLGGIYLPGAFLPEYAESLAGNTALREAILEFAQNGGVVYSEGAGTAYLCSHYRCGENLFDGVGILRGTAVSDHAHVNLRETVTVDESILGRSGLVVRGVSSGEWRLMEEDAAPRMLRLTSGKGQSQQEGYAPGAQQLLTFGFNHFGSNLELARNIVDACEVVQGIRDE